MSNSSMLVQALLAAFFAILCALSSLGGGGMIIGARTGVWSGKPLPYLTIERDFVPVLDLSGVPCMYNQAPLVGIPEDDPSRFFYNQGTGEFTWGD